MAEKEFIDQYTKLLEVMARARKSLTNLEASTFAFDGIVESYQEIFDLFVRDEMLDKLRKLLSEENVTMGTWMKLKTQIDYMASMERDMRQRNRSRLDNYRTGALSKDFIALSMKSLLTDLEEIIG